MKKLLFILSIAAGMLAAAWWVSGASLAEDATPAAPGKDGDVLQRNLERWNKMTPEEQQKLRERYEHWKKLSPDEKQRIQENFKRFQQLSPEKREELLRLRSKLAHVSPATRTEMMKRFGTLRRIPPDRREALLQRVHTIGELLHDDVEEMKKAAPDSPEFRKAMGDLRLKGTVLGVMSEKELEQLRAMPPEERRAAIDARVLGIRELLQGDVERMKALEKDSPEYHKAVHEVRRKMMILSQLAPAQIERLRGLAPAERDEEIGKLMKERMSRPMHPWHGPGTHPPRGPHPPPGATPPAEPGP